jgi:hypothetical protein
MLVFGFSFFCSDVELLEISVKPNQNFESSISQSNVDVIEFHLLLNKQVSIQRLQDKGDQIQRYYKRNWHFCYFFFSGYTRLDFRISMI